MIIKFKGIIENIEDDFIDIDVQGVVYRVLMSSMNILQLGTVGSTIIIYIYEIIKEDSRLLVGFLHYSDRETFSDLLTVQGVGGKMAINIMSHLDTEMIINSIHNEDSEIFRKISGVGNKLALRIINELREKIKKKIINKKILGPKQESSMFHDLVSCLLNLGFSQKVCESTASYVINKNQNKKLEELIPIAVKSLSNPIR